MTFEELKKSVKELKYSRYGKIMGRCAYNCNLFDRYFIDPRLTADILDVTKNNNVWEVYSCDSGRGVLEAKFDSEDILYEYVYCRYKEIADNALCYLRDKSSLLYRLKRYKIPASEYSFYGGMRKNCMCVGKNENTSEDILEVYYSDGINKKSYGIFYHKYQAYNFLFYLVMKKHVSTKKRWW